MAHTENSDRDNNFVKDIETKKKKNNVSNVTRKTQERKRKRDKARQRGREKPKKRDEEKRGRE